MLGVNKLLTMVKYTKGFHPIVVSEVFLLFIIRSIVL
jgi:hypothetical protein